MESPSSSSADSQGSAKIKGLAEVLATCEDLCATPAVKPEITRELPRGANSHLIILITVGSKQFVAKENKHHDASDRETTLATLRHIQKIQKLDGSQRLLPLLWADIPSSATNIWCITPLMEFGTLTNYFATTKFPDYTEASQSQRKHLLALVASLNSAVKFMHDNETAHTDLNDTNVFITGRRELKIGDFTHTKTTSVASEVFHVSKLYSHPCLFPTAWTALVASSSKMDAYKTIDRFAVGILDIYILFRILITDELQEEAPGAAADISALETCISKPNLFAVARDFIEGRLPDSEVCAHLESLTNIKRPGAL